MLNPDPPSSPTQPPQDGGTSAYSTFLTRAWYAASITDFLATDPNTIIGQLSRNSDFSVDQTQIHAWLAEIQVMKHALTSPTSTQAPQQLTSNLRNGAIFFEFVIPRMGRRVDVILISGNAIFTIEFKAGESQFQRSGIEQVWDYALDLKNFHETSHNAAIIPLLVAMGAKSAPPPQFQMDPDKVYRPIPVTSATLANVLHQSLAQTSGPPIDTEAWLSGSYLPTPTIVEAARALYAQHSVDAIARHDAGAKNLAVTSRRVDDLIDQARQQHIKMICFVTGVPGAGKTLVGLNVATQRRDEHTPTHAVFLSGNGPLVAVLREALTRDEFDRQLEEYRKNKTGKRPTKGRIAESVKAFIQNVHHFRDEALREEKAPADHVVIFDEAQRAWNLQQTKKFMSEKKQIRNFDMSEPQFLISYMDRHPDWAFIVCLVGGGQEINTGEAGIGAWITAARDHFPHWQLVISDKLTDSEYAAAEYLCQPSPTNGAPIPEAHKLMKHDPEENKSIHIDLAATLSTCTDPEGIKPIIAAGKESALAGDATRGSATHQSSDPEGVEHSTPQIRYDDRLHLAVSMRSFRAENVSNFVKQLLDLNIPAAREQLYQIQDKYPIRITRDLHAAKLWLRQQARGTERYGLVASSKAMRLKPHAIFIGTNNDVVNPVHYFLNDAQDVRSSFYLEDAATEFQVQGLELDWACVSWDADMRLTPDGWSFHDFKGSKWQNIKKEDRRRYTLNAYRVLLTRARQGMVIFIPPGDRTDHTRPPAYYDETFRYLSSIGVQEV